MKHRKATTQYRDSLLAELRQRGEYTPPVHTDPPESEAAPVFTPDEREAYRQRKLDREKMESQFLTNDGPSPVVRELLAQSPTAVHTQSQSQSHSPAVHSNSQSSPVASPVHTPSNSPDSPDSPDSPTVHTFNDSEHVVGVPVAPVPTTPVANQIPVGYDSNLFKSYYRIDPSAIIPGLHRNIVNTVKLKAMIHTAIVRNLYEVSGITLDSIKDGQVVDRIRAFAAAVVGGRGAHAFRRLLNYAATIPELRASLLGLGAENGAGLERAVAGCLFKALCAAGAQAEMSAGNRGTDLAPLVLTLMRGNLTSLPATKGVVISDTLLADTACARLFYGADYDDIVAGGHSIGADGVPLQFVSHKGQNEYMSRLCLAADVLVEEQPVNGMFESWVKFAEDKFGIVNKSKIRQDLKKVKEDRKTRDPYNKGFSDNYTVHDWETYLKYLITSSSGKSYIPEIRALRVKLTYMERRIAAELKGFNEAVQVMIRAGYLSKDVLYNSSASSVFGMFEQLIKDGVIDQKTGSMVNLDVETYLDEQYNRT